MYVENIYNFEFTGVMLKRRWRWTAINLITTDKNHINILYNRQCKNNVINIGL